MALHMTLRNYNAIADVIRPHVEAEYGACEAEIIEILQDVVSGIADHCEEDWHLFDRAAFYEQCGMGLTET